MPSVDPNCDCAGCEEPDVVYGPAGEPEDYVHLAEHAPAPKLQEVRLRPGARDVTVPAEGEWFIRDGEVYRVIESEFTDSDDGGTGYQIWVHYA